MKQKICAFLHKMKYNLRYRLMTALLVCILPIGLISCILFVIQLNRTEQEIYDSNQARLEEAMAYWEQDSTLIDWIMEYFISQYGSELNYKNFRWSDVTRYNMFFELEEILPKAGHDGMVALVDNQTGQVLAQIRDANASDARKDSQVRAFTSWIEKKEQLPDLSWLEVGGQYYLLKRYDYRNGSIYFALDVVNSIWERVEPLRSTDTTIYVADGSSILELTDSGALQTHLTWEECLSVSPHSTLFWESKELPIAVCMIEKTGFFERLPWEIWVLLLVVLGCLGNAFHLPRLIRLEVLEPTGKLRDAMQQIQSNHLDFRMKDTCPRNSEDMQYLFDTFDQMADEIEASREKDKKMYQAEMDNLRLQVNPHMLLNSLNTIYSLAQMKKFEAIQEYALHLVDYFRYALRRNDNLVRVAQELQFIKTYIEIQKIRYPGALVYVYAVDPECEKALVPPLLIQNFVENAVKYAVKPGKVTEILLNVKRVEDRLHISVTDTGAGMKPEIQQRLASGEVFVDAMGQKHIGVWNCRRRIEVFYNETPRINILSGSGGTQIYLDVPYWTEVQQ